MSAQEPNQGHNWVLANLPRYVNHQMSADEENATTTHIASCPICQKQLAEMNTNNEVETPGPIGYVSQQQGETEPGLRGYDLVNDEAIQFLANFKGNSPVLSLFLDMGPQARPGTNEQETLKSLIDARQREFANRPRDYQRAFQTQAERLFNWVAHEYDHVGRGLAVFSCADPDLFQVFRLPVGGWNLLRVNDRPYLQPLLALTDDHERYMVMLADKRTVRILVVYMGGVQEVAVLTGDTQPRPKSGDGNRTDMNQRHSDMHTLWNVKRAVDAAEEIWRREECDWLLLGGIEQVVAMLQDQLPKAMAERQAGDISVSLKASNQEILQEVQRVDAAREKKQEAQRVDMLLTKALGSGPGVVGLEDTLGAIVQGNVLTLVVDEAFHHPGFECPNCHFLGTSEQSQCPLCGSKLEKQADVVERAVGRAVADGADIEILGSEDARKQLEGHGRIGAFLRYSTTSQNQPSGGLAGPA